MAGPIVLLEVTGRDPGESIGAVFALLDRVDARVLDVGRSEIFRATSLGLLVELPHSTAVAALEADVDAFAAETAMHAVLTPVSAAQYASWAAAQGSPRYLLTVLARQLHARQLARVHEVVSAHGLRVRRVTRLSGRPGLDEPVGASRSIVEFELRGGAVDQQALRRTLLDLLRPLDVDVSVQMDDADRRNRRLVAFDMDSTLIRGEVIDELAAEYGVGEQVAAITAAAMRGELDFQESLRRRVALLAGADAALLDAVAARIELSDGAERLLRVLRRLGYRTAILSGGFEQVGERVRARLGIDHLHANVLEVQGGKLTGQVVGRIVDGPRKAALLHELVAREGLRMAQSIAVGDGANDLPMLASAGLGIAFRAKPIVAASAGHAITHFGLDAILYLIGFSERDLRELDTAADAATSADGHSSPAKL